MATEAKALPTIPEPTRRLWFLAHMMQTWKVQHRPMLNKAYQSEDAEQTLEALRAFRPRLQGWLDSIDDLLERGGG